MLKNKIGILPVVDNHQVYGVITDRDVFQAFLEIAGYGEEGIRVQFVTENEVGVLGKIVSLIVEENLNISHTVNIPRKDGKVIIEVQIDGSISFHLLLYFTLHKKRSLTAFYYYKTFAEVRVISST